MASQIYLDSHIHSLSGKSTLIRISTLCRESLPFGFSEEEEEESIDKLAILGNSTSRKGLAVGRIFHSQIST